MSSSIEFQRHDAFAVPLWTTVVSALGPHQLALVADVSAISAPAGERVDLGTQTGVHWNAWRTVVLALTDRLAQASEIRWRMRQADDYAITFDSPDDVAEERESLESHARATFTAALWLSAPPEAASHPSLSLSLRNPFNHLTRRYEVPTYVHHPAQPLRMLVYPSFLEQFFAVSDPGPTWSSSAVALVSDVLYY